MSLPRLRSLIVAAILAVGSNSFAADRAVFSGPQVGEAMSSFEVIAVYDGGKKVNPIEIAAGKPTLMVFVHKLTRPGIALTRSLTSYAHGQSKNGAVGVIVWLVDDSVKEKEYLTRAKKSLNFAAPVGVSVDGGEGPGVYGLNRNVELTVLVAHENKVTANFAIIQPSVTEAAKIANELAKLIKQPSPSQTEMEKLAYPGRGQMAMQNPSGELRSLMRTLIGTDTNEKAFNQARESIEKWVGDKKPRQVALHRMANAVMQRGIGTEKAQALLKNWIEKYEPKNSGAKSEGSGTPSKRESGSPAKKAVRDANP